VGRLYGGAQVEERNIGGGVAEVGRGAQDCEQSHHNYGAVDSAAAGIVSDGFESVEKKA